MVAPSHEHYYWPMKIGRTAWWSSIALLWLIAFPRLGAQTDEIQVYTGEVETPGKANLTIHANYTPSGRTVAEFPGGVVPRVRSTVHSSGRNRSTTSSRWSASRASCSTSRPGLGSA